MLTQKQENFCTNIVSGMTAKDAYKAAYNTSASEQVIYNESAKLLKRDDITERIKELNKPLENHAQAKALSNREKKQAIIWEEIQNARTQQDHAAVARYLDILNKMDQEYIQINKDITEEKTNIETLDNDTLFKLVN
jgi:hypothetical protein